jgi:hypothetical protein
MTDPVFRRHPDADTLVAALRQRLCSLRPLGIDCPGEHLDAIQARRLLLGRALLSGGIASTMRKLWGKPTGTVQGQVKPALTFFFEVEGQAILGLAEPLPKGLTWWWVAPNETPVPAPYFTLTDPSVKAFWPVAVDALIERWWKAPENRVERQRIEKSLPGVIIQMLSQAPRLVAAGG